MANPSLALLYLERLRETAPEARVSRLFRSQLHSLAADINLTIRHLKRPANKRVRITTAFRGEKLYKLKLSAARQRYECMYRKELSLNRGAKTIPWNS